MTEVSKTIDRLLTFKNSQGQSARGTLLRMTRSGVVFEVYNPYSIIQLSEVLQELTVLRSGAPIYSGKAVVSSLVNTGLMLIVSATLVDRWNDLTFLLSRSDDLKSEVEHFISDWEKSKRIRPGYQLAVGELRSFLSQLSPWLDQIDIASFDDPDRVPENVVMQIKDPLIPKVVEIQQLFESEARLIGEDELEAHRMYAQRDLLPLMMRAPFFHRSYTKPLGYAGDYMMVKMMVEGKRNGPTTYARLVNDFYLNIDLVRAHKNRLKILERRLTELAGQAEAQGKRISILNVGCGPAIEIVRFIQNSQLCERCDFHLIDFNAETIEYARQAIETATREAGRSPSIKYTQKSVHSLLKRSSSNKKYSERQYDFVYCAGLFDYLSDRVCQRLLDLFCDWTNISGSVMATNVHPDNPTRLIMEHVIDWHLIHRTMKDLASLAPAQYSKFVFDDDTHMNVFMEISVSEIE